MRIAVLSNVTSDMIAAELQKKAEVYVPAGFNTWQSEIRDEGSLLFSFCPDSISLILHADASKRVWEEDSFLLDRVSEWCTSIELMMDRFSQTTVFVIFTEGYRFPCQIGSGENVAASARTLIWETVNKLHKDGFLIYMIPISEMASELGLDSFYSKKMWYMGSIPYSVSGNKRISDEILRYIDAVKGRKKKCLLVDLDNTLWGGVIGEDGIEGIALSDSGIGAPYKDLQRLLRRMREQGVLLAILSKNNESDVAPVFSHPDMILKREDFVAECIGWSEKTDDIVEISEELNLALDSFVFLDDNPVEREKMRAVHPEVTVIDLPVDPAEYPSTVSKLYEEFFFTLDITAEDVGKTTMYHAERERSRTRARTGSLDDYIRQLEMVIDIHVMRADEIKRVVHLVNKTNQFNLTTRRYSEQDILSIHRQEFETIFTIQMSDRFGDLGLTGVLIIRRENKTAYIDSFLLSCRVMGRSAENEILACVKQWLRRVGVIRVSASYYRTEKNAPVHNLYDRMGFKLVRINHEGENNEQRVYECGVEELVESTGLYQEVRWEC